MQSWQYCAINALTSRGTVQVVFFDVNGPTIQETELNGITNAIANLGQSGWEMVSVVHGADSTSYFFKRPTP